MATIINNPSGQQQPAPVQEGGGGTGIVVTVLLVVVILLILFFVFGRGAGRMMGNDGGTPTAAPSNGTNINVPDKMDINVQKK